MTSLEDRIVIIDAINESIINGARKTKACKAVDLCIRTYQRWYKNQKVQKDQRPIIQRKEPNNKLSPKETAQILELCNSAEYQSLPPGQIVPKLADNGVYLASESTIHRILKSNNQHAHRGREKPKKKKKSPTSFSASAPNQVWSWDISYMPTQVIGQFYYLYLFMDIYSRKIVAADIYESENAEDASDLLQRGCWSERISQGSLVLHSDNGAPMKSFTLREKMNDLGITASRSRPRVSNDNPYSEALFKTVKYCPQWPEKGFSSIEEARLWLADFINWYNNEHRHSGIKYVTPNQRHNMEDEKILTNRKEVYEAAKKSNPSRWSKETRDWQMIETVELNPEVKNVA